MCIIIVQKKARILISRSYISDVFSFGDKESICHRFPIVTENFVNNYGLNTEKCFFFLFAKLLDIIYFDCCIVDGLIPLRG